MAQYVSTKKAVPSFSMKETDVLWSQQDLGREGFVFQSRIPVEKDLYSQKVNQAVASFANHNFLVFVLLLYGIMLNWNFNAAYNSHWKTMWQKVEFNLSRLKTFRTHTITLCMFLVCGNILPRWKSVEKINQKLYQ